MVWLSVDSLSCTQTQEVVRGVLLTTSSTLMAYPAQVLVKHVQEHLAQKLFVTSQRAFAEREQGGCFLLAFLQKCFKDDTVECFCALPVDVRC